AVRLSARTAQGWHVGSIELDCRSRGGGAPVDDVDRLHPRLPHATKHWLRHDVRLLELINREASHVQRRQGFGCPRSRVVARGDQQLSDADDGGEYAVSESARAGWSRHTRSLA